MTLRTIHARTNLLTGLLLVSLIGVASAQAPAIPGDLLQWDQGGASLVEVQAHRYQAKFDGGAAVTLVVKCTGTAAPFVCAATFPALTTGDHSVTLTAAVVLPDGRVVESPATPAFEFRIVAMPPTPVALRIAAGS